MGNDEMSEKIKRYKVKGRDLPAIAIEFLPDVVVSAKDHDAALAAKEARIADLDIACDRAYRNGLIAGFRYGINEDDAGYQRSLSAYSNGIHEAFAAQQQAEPCQGTNCGTTTCQHSDECLAETAISQGWEKYATSSEDGREAPEVVGYLLSKGNQLSRMPAGNNDFPLMTVAQHERILAGKDAEIARLNELVEHRDYLARIDHIRAELRAERQQSKDSGITILPDGSAYALASYPLPSDHWIYADREYADGEDEPKELHDPILNHADHRETVIAAVRYAVRGATNCGKEKDFDPDALVQNVVYALCGPYGRAQPARQVGGDDRLEEAERLVREAWRLMPDDGRVAVSVWHLCASEFINDAALLAAQGESHE